MDYKIKRKLKYTNYEDSRIFLDPGILVKYEKYEVTFFEVHKLKSILVSKYNT